MNSTFEIFIKLTGCAMISVGLSIICYLLKRKTPFGKLSSPVKQIIIGFLFGLVAILGTEIGVDVGGATANARDAAPICAGLLFGPQAGIIAGIIGGVWRWIAVAWGAGMYSRLACTVSTILAGFYAAFLRKIVFDNKHPTVALAFVTGGVIEIVHLTILFITHFKDPEQAFEIVKICTAPMVLCNGASVMIATIAIKLISSGFHRNQKRYKNISQLFQVPMLIAVLFAFIFSTGFVYLLQTFSAERSAQSIIELNIEAVKENIRDSSSDIQESAKNHHIGESGYVTVLDKNMNVVSSTGKEKHTTIIDGNTVFDKITETEIDDIPCLVIISECDDYFIEAAMPKTEVYETRDATAYVNSYLEIIIFATLFIMIYIIIKKVVVDNLHRINNSLGKIIRGNLETTIDVNSSDEFASLSNDINSTVSTLKQYIDEAAARIDKELAFAKSIQHAALPSVFPPYPDRKDFDIHADMKTAKEVGGDFYDFYMLDSNHIVIMIADVSGKGIPAALFMMRAKTIIKSLAETGISADEVFTRANSKLCEGNEADMFVTAWMAIINTDTGHVEFVNAGHNPPLIYRKNSGFEYLKSRAGLVLAGMDGLKYKKQELDLEPGDKIYLYTDGVTEAVNNRKELYGEERLSSYLNAHTELSCEQTITGVKSDVDRFAGDEEQFDDITMLMFDYKGRVNDDNQRISC